MSACTTQLAYIGKTTKTLIEHRLTLPGCRLRVGDHTDAGRRFLQTLKQKHPGLHIIPETRRNP